MEDREVMNNPSHCLRQGAHTTYDLWYHFVWIPKYRHSVLTGTTRDYLHERLLERCQLLEWEIDSMAIEPDHVHLFLGAPPRWSPADIAYHLKKATGQELMAEFPTLRHQFRKGALWARGYFVSSAGENRVSDQIRAYIHKQGQLAPLEAVRQSDQLSLF